MSLLRENNCILWHTPGFAGGMLYLKRVFFTTANKTSNYLLTKLHAKNNPIKLAKTRLHRN